MILSTAILQEHSKGHTQKIATWIGSDPQRAMELMQLFLSDNCKLAQRAAWVVSTVTELHPSLMKPYLPAMVARLDGKDIHDSLKRHVLRAIHFMELEEQLHEPILNLCFRYLGNPKEALAVRAFALSTVGRLSSSYPELRNELKIIIEDALLHEPAASFKSRARKLLKEMWRT